MVALRDEMTNEYKVFGIISLSTAMNNIFENLSSCVIMHAEIERFNDPLEIFELPSPNNDLNELYEKTTNEVRNRDLQHVNGLLSSVVTGFNSEVIMRSFLPLDDGTTINVGPETDTTHNQSSHLKD